MGRDLHIPIIFRVLHILLRDEFLQLWLRLEEKFTFEWMNTKLDDPDAWVPKFSELTCKDKNLIYYSPKCVDEFVTFLTLMNTRHKNLNHVIAEKKFLNLLVKSLRNFVHKMEELGCLMVALSQKYSSVANGACYMREVLEEWSQDVYFIRLLEEHGEPKIGTIFSYL